MTRADIEEGKRLLSLSGSDSPTISQHYFRLLAVWMTQNGPALLAAAEERDALKQERDALAAALEKCCKDFQLHLDEMERSNVCQSADVRAYFYEGASAHLAARDREHDAALIERLAAESDPGHRGGYAMHEWLLEQAQKARKGEL